MVNPLAESEQFMSELLTSVGCMSSTQAHLILYRKYGYEFTKARSIISHLRSLKLLHYSTTFMKNGLPEWVGAGPVLDENGNDLNADTIRALGVALKVITDPDDYRFIYKPHLGTELAFYTNSTRYLISLSSAQFPNKILHVAEQEKDSHNRVAVGGNEELAKSTDAQILFVFPTSESKKSVFSVMNDLNLDIPHSIVLLYNKDLFASTEMEIFNA